MNANVAPYRVQTFPHKFGEGGIADTQVLNDNFLALAGLVQQGFSEAVLSVQAIQTAALASGVQFTPGGTWGPAPSSAGTNPAVTVTIGTHGLALVVLTANLMPTSANVSGNGVLASVALSGANTVAANTSTCVSAGTNAASASTQQANQVINIQSSTVTLLTGLTPGATTFAMQFSCDTTYPGQVGYCALIVVVL